MGVERRSNDSRMVVEPLQRTLNQGWAQGSFVEAEAEVEAERSRQRRGRLNSRQGRGEATPWKKSPPPRCIAVPNLVALSQTVWQRVNGLVAPPCWVEVIYVILLYVVSRGLNLNLSSVGGRSLKLTDYYRAEARR